MDSSAETHASLRCCMYTKYIITQYIFGNAVCSKTYLTSSKTCALPKTLAHLQGFEVQHLKSCCRHQLGRASKRRTLHVIRNNAEQKITCLRMLCPLTIRNELLVHFATNCSYIRSHEGQVQQSSNLVIVVLWAKTHVSTAYIILR